MAIRPAGKKPAPRKAKAKAEDELSLADLPRLVQAFKDNEALAKQADAEKSNLRAMLLKFVQEHGEEDDRGHIWLELPSPVAGVAALKAEKRISKTFNVERAEEWADAHPSLEDILWEVFKTVPEDRVLAANYEGKMSDEDVEYLYDLRETVAFVTTKEES